MATVVNYTCKSLIKLIPGYSLYHLIAVCVKILGGWGWGGTPYNGLYGEAPPEERVSLSNILSGESEKFI